MSQQELIPHPEPHDRMREHEVDRTPPAVAEQGVLVAAEELSHAPTSFLDVCAGDGVFARIASKHWPDAWIDAVEKRSEELPYLEAIPHCRPFIMDFERFARGCSARYDLICGNPAFSLWPVILRHSLGLLAPGGIVCLYLKSTIGHSTEPSERCDLFDVYPPSLQARVLGRCRHRLGRNPGTGKLWGTDNAKYSFWLWRDDVVSSCARPRWTTMNLELLPDDLRKRLPPRGEP